ncbi:MAG: isoprenylcysteine carboxylmethyltransferase family protein [Calditrichaeota bacterium]|nr:isoprenylcysteine carboxylmethyltransferase family protein [Calditrichota bacterium]
MDWREVFFRRRGFTPLPFLLAALIWAQFDLWLVIVGVALGLAGEALRIWSIRYAGGATRTRKVGAPDLVTDGPYSRMRNPLYLANMSIYIGYALASGALFPYLPIAALLFFIIQYSLIISLEEVSLEKLFAEKYRAYCRTVPRLLPKLSRSPYSPPTYSLSAALREERSTLSGFLTVWILLMARFIL